MQCTHICCVCTGKNKRATQLQLLGRMKNAKMSEKIAEVPAEWAAHINSEDFSCPHVFELLVRKVIDPIYTTGGRQIRSGVETGNLVKMSSLEAQALEDSISDASDAEDAL